MKRAPIRLQSTGTQTYSFKAGLIVLFRSARSTGNIVLRTPSVVRRIGEDIADAWRESALPKA